MVSGYFNETSPLRELAGHRLRGLAGPRALLMMAAHPVAFAGFFAHTGALADPYARLERTARVMDAIAFGTRAEADRLTRRVRRSTAGCGHPPRARGRFPAGTPYRADDPELLLWILAALADSGMLVYGKYVGVTARPRRAVARLPRRRRLFGLEERRDARDAGTRRLHAGMPRAATCLSPSRRVSWPSRSCSIRRCRCISARWSSWSTR